MSDQRYLEATWPEITPLMPAPCSAIQRGIFLHELLHPGTPVYNVPIEFRVRGRVNTDVLLAALEAIAARHPILRSRFIELDGEPIQEAVDGVVLDFVVIDLSSETPARQIESVSAARQKAAAEPFTLSIPRPFRTRILMLKTEVFFFLFTFHHIVFDAASATLFFAELRANYEAILANGKTLLPPAPLYGAFAIWQTRQIENGAYDASLAHLRAALADISKPVALPFARPRPGHQDAGGAERHLGIAIADRVRILSQDYSATPFIVLFAAYAALLYRFTGFDRLPIVVPVSTRFSGDAEFTIGPFINLVVVDISVAAAVTFSTFLEEVRARVIDALEHARTPFELVIDALGCAGGASPFNLSFNHDDVNVDPINLQGVKLSALSPVKRYSKFSLTFSTRITPDGLVAAVEYDRYTCSNLEANQLLDGLTALLDAATTHPETPIAALPIMDARERIRLMKCATRPRNYPRDKTTLDYIEANIGLRGDGAAVIDEEGAISWRELGHRAGAVAAALIARGVSAGDRVGFITQRDRHAVVSMLGIMKARACYVPFDPETPAVRISHLAESCGVRLLLVDERNVTLAAAAGLANARVDDLERTASSNAGHVSGRLGPDSPCYVLFTSGSTGTPKATLVSHGNLVNYALQVGHEIGALTRRNLAELVFGCISTLSADLGNTSIYAALVFGGTLRMFSREESMDAQKLTVAGRVDVLKIVPTHLEALINAAGEGAAQVLPHHCLVLGGEKLTWTLLEHLQAIAPKLCIMNHFGPTETTVGCLTYAVAASRDSDSVPIGLPLGNYEAHILDVMGAPLPFGVAGELYVGGEGVSLGYINAPDENLHRFVQLNLVGESRRYYRTGDRARRLWAGPIEFIGRFDFQKKVRGYRIEPAEIEHAAMQFPGVVKALVQFIDSDPSITEIVLFCSGVAHDEASALSTFLGDRLPSYMCPNEIVPLDTFPLTINGKIDARALLQLFAKPRAPLKTGLELSSGEQRVAEAWGAVIGRAPTNPADDFFASGGSSLMAMKLASRLQQEWQAKWTVRDVFETRTLCAITALLESRQGTWLPHRTKVTGRKEGKLTYSQERLLFLNHILPSSAAYNVPVAYRVSGLLDAHRLGSALSIVAQRHDAMRISLHQGAEGWMQRVDPKAALTLAREDWSTLSDAERDIRLTQLLESEGRHLFDLAAAPLARAKLIKMEDSEHIFCLTLHHIISDGWSREILLKDLSIAYERGLEGFSTPAPSYLDYASSDRADGLTAETAAAVELIAAPLRDLPAFLEIPTDHPRPAVQSFRGCQLSFTIPRMLDVALGELARSTGTTRFVGFLAGVATLLARLSGAEEIPLGLPVANRSNVNTAGLFGFVANTAVLVARIGNTTTFRQLLRTAGADMLALLDKQHLPFERLVEAVNPQRSTSFNPIFQVMVSDDRESVDDLRLGTATAIRLQVENGGAKFDLTFNIREGAAGVSIGRLEFAHDLYERSTAQRLSSQLLIVIRAALAAPDLALQQLDVLTAREHAVLVKLNATTIPFPAKRSPILDFEDRAYERPNAVALKDGGRIVHYGELNRLSGGVANWLKTNGLAQGQAVGLGLRRSIELMIALLGIMKAGGVYVPVEPELPPSRLANIIQASGARIAVVEDDLVRSLPVGVAPLTRAKLVGLSEADIRAPTTGEHEKVYILFTSGSTGTPKGVMVGTASLSNYLSWCRSHYLRGAPGSTVLHTPMSFDLTVTSLFLPLTTGGTLHILPHGNAISELVTFLTSRCACLDFLKLTPLHMSLLAQMLDLTSVRWAIPLLIAGGENLSYKACSDWLLTRCTDRIVNEYGPTEATVGCTFFDVDRNNLASGGSVPIGAPIANTRIQILDPFGRHVLAGAKGELFLSGDCLCEGYLDPELTQRSFVKLPRLGGGRELAYRTGDVASFDMDGILHYWGRNDGQLKIRGIRVERDEVRHALERIPGVRESYVLKVEEEGRQGFLASYIVPDTTSDLSANVIRDALRAELPDYMVPEEFIILPEGLPLTRNGKMDAVHLPPIKRIVEAVPKDGRVIERVLEIWRGLLGRADVGDHESFFDAGGNSLGLMRMQNELERVFGRKLTLLDLFRAPTATAITRMLESGVTETSCGSVPATSDVQAAAARRRSIMHRRPKQ